MTRATRSLTIFLPLALLYLLTLLHVLPVPLISADKADAILPVVRLPSSLKPDPHLFAS